MAAHVQNFSAVHNLPCFTLFSCITGAASLFGNIECHVLKWPDKTFAYFANRKNKTMERILNNSSWIDWLNILRVVLLISSIILSALFYSAYLAKYINYSLLMLQRSSPLAWTVVGRVVLCLLDKNILQYCGGEYDHFLSKKMVISWASNNSTTAVVK